MRLKIVCSLFLNPITGMVYFAFPQTTFCSPCDQNEICVSYIERPFNVWYVWVFLLLLLILILRCMIVCCLQCWIKRRSKYSTSRMITVVALSKSDSIYVTESSQCHQPQTWMPHQNTEASFTSSTISLGGLESGAPPSYEELFNTSKF
ncbi:transmembrane protein 207 [Rhinophrynus dorsalis]